MPSLLGIMLVRNTLRHRISASSPAGARLCFSSAVDASTAAFVGKATATFVGKATATFVGKATGVPTCTFPAALISVPVVSGVTCPCVSTISVTGTSVPESGGTNALALRRRAFLDAALVDTGAAGAGGGLGILGKGTAGPVLNDSMRAWGLRPGAKNAFFSASSDIKGNRPVTTPAMTMGGENGPYSASRVLANALWMTAWLTNGVETPITVHGGMSRFAYRPKPP